MSAIRWSLILSALAALALAMLGASAHINSRAWTSTHLALIHKDEDSIRNYDYTERGAVNDNTIQDFPWTMLFKNNAEVDRVKNAYRNRGWNNPAVSPMHGRANDGAGGFWDADSGVKTVGMTTTAHMRLYADEPDDHMYNLTWGWYVFGTTHYDKWEGIPWKQCFGWSEDAEYEAATTAMAVKGWEVHRNNASDVSNYESFRREEGGISGDHIWDNNGRRSTVTVP